MLLPVVLCAVVGLLLPGSAAQGHEHAEEDWWKHMQLYQIYPRSYKDSDGDGIGDLNGITENLFHLADIGVQAVWLSPIFVSPMKDFGYDIADFYNIAEEYGNMTDFENLLAEAKKLNIKILLDFVPNHSSNECDWFKKSVDGVEEYKDYYVWHEGRPNPENATGRPLPPSNWISVFRKSAWTWNEKRQAYYLHQFLPEQPDLNYREPKVIKEMQNVLKFWLQKGVSGFRVDAIPHLVEVEPDKDTGLYPDEPKDENGSTDPDDYGHLMHIHTRERNETYQRVYEWRKTLDDFAAAEKTETKVLLMEAMSDIDLVMKYYGDGVSEGAHFPFNFGLTFANKDNDANSLRTIIQEWFEKLPKNRTTNWVVGNHDQGRVATRYGPERSDGVLMMSMLLPGVSVTYQGEEIAMENFYLTFEQTQDPQACNAGKDLYNSTSRDPERTPFQWNTDKNAGFSNASETWLPVATNYMTLNLKAQKEAPKSHLKVYKALSKLRSHESIMHGNMTVANPNRDVLVIKRYHSGDPSIVVVVNTAAKVTKVNLKTNTDGLEDKMDVVVASLNSKREVGEEIDSADLTLQSYESLVLKSGASALVPFSLMMLMTVVANVFRR